MRLCLASKNTLIVTQAICASLLVNLRISRTEPLRDKKGSSGPSSLLLVRPGATSSFLLLVVRHLLLLAWHLFLVASLLLHEREPLPSFFISFSKDMFMFSKNLGTGSSRELLASGRTHTLRPVMHTMPSLLQLNLFPTLPCGVLVFTSDALVSTSFLLLPVRHLLLLAWHLLYKFILVLSKV